MKKLFAVALFALMSCATAESARRIRPDGQPAPLPEEMPAGRLACEQMCKDAGRPGMQEYDYDGNCICKPQPRLFSPKKVGGDQT